MMRSLMILAMMFSAWVDAAEDHVFYLPHYTHKSGAWETTLSLHNPGFVSQAVNVKAFDGAGQLQTEHRLFLAPRGGFSEPVQTLIPGLTAETGWLEMHAPDEIRGLMQFTATATGGSSTLSLSGEAHENLVFTALNEGEGWASGFALVNVSDQIIGLDLELLDWQGEQLAWDDITIPARGKRVEMTASFFGLDQLPDRVVMRVTATGPVSGVALSFKGNSDQIVAVPAEPFTPDTGLAELAARLQGVLDADVANHEAVHGMVLNVATADGAFVWSGASGMADPEAQTPMNTNHPFRLASVGKTMTAALVLLLEEEGLLNIEAEASDYLSAEILSGLHVFDGVDYGDQITLRQLLQHTSGLGDHFFDVDSDGDGVSDLIFRLLSQPDEVWTGQKVVDYARENTPAVAPPGMIWHYSDLGYVLLAMIVEQTTGQSYHQALRARIFEPLGMASTWLEYREEPVGMEPISHAFLGETDYTHIQSPSIDWGGGGQASTVGDLSMFLQAVLSGRLFNSPFTFQRMLDMVDTGEGFYGMGLEMNVVPGVGTLIGHSGFSGAYMYYWEEGDMFLTGTSNQSEFPLLNHLRAITTTLLDLWREDPADSEIEQGLASIGTIELGYAAIRRDQGPTVVFESGLGGTKESWATLFRQVGESAAVFAYDRAGYGQSTFLGQSRGADVVVGELRALLQATNQKPPYILVGHSLGGLYMQYYARTFPEEVAGLVMVDSSIALQEQKACETFPDACQGEPGEPDFFLEPIYSETRDKELIGTQVEQAGPYPSVPGVVLTARNEAEIIFDWLWDWWYGLQADLAQQAGAEHVVVYQSGHHIQLDQPAAIIDAVQNVIKAAQ